MIYIFSNPIPLFILKKTYQQRLIILLHKLASEKTYVTENMIRLCRLMVYTSYVSSHNFSVKNLSVALLDVMITFQPGNVHKNILSQTQAQKKIVGIFSYNFSYYDRREKFFYPYRISITFPERVSWEI